MKPLVSIICITFNQEKYIREALDGFLMQKTNFPFEIIIHDDASSDNTAEIIKEYTAKYPKIFKPIFETENQYSKGSWRFLNEMFTKAKGKYITTCEGDDYWTSADKLQKQVDFLESHPNFTLSFHRAKVLFENGEESYLTPSTDKMNGYTLENLLKDNFIPTCTVMYRKQNYDSIPDKIMPQDLYMHAYHASFGKIGFMQDTMAVYRRQSDGVWWDSQSNMEKIYIKHHYMLINLYAELLKIFKNSNLYKTIINNHLHYLLGTLIDIDGRNKTNMFVQAAANFPDIVGEYAISQKKTIDDVGVENNKIKSVLNQTEDELQAVKNSKWFKLNPRKLVRKWVSGDSSDSEN